jgi:hypothetical protein
MFGYKIPTYTAIKLNNWMASKDDRNFNLPQSFDETRMARRECAFGRKTFGAGRGNVSNGDIKYCIINTV